MTIKKRQNEDLLLKIQYAARYKYNVAECLNKICFWLSLFPLVTILPFISNMEAFALVSTLITDAILLVLTFFVCRFVKQAASLRKYFDNYVFNLGDDKIDAPSVKELALQICNKHHKKAMIQINNTAHDTPPGVKDWYDIPNDSNNHSVIYKCQCENGWWTKKLFARLIINYSIYLGIIIIIFLILKLGFNISCFDICIAISGILLKFIERIYNMIIYIMISLKTEGAIAVMSVSQTSEQLKCLQAFINEQRAIPILLPNKSHLKKVSLWSHLYHSSH